MVTPKPIPCGASIYGLLGEKNLRSVAFIAAATASVTTIPYSTMLCI